MRASELDRFRDDIPVLPWLGADHDKSGSDREALPIFQYASDRGWDEDEVDKLHDTIRRKPQEACAMLQAWLFFGVLESATMTKWPVREVDGQSKWLRAGGPTGHTLSFSYLQYLRRDWMVADQHSEVDISIRKQIYVRTMTYTSRLIQKLGVMRQSRETLGDLVNNTDALDKLDSIIRCGTLLLEMVLESCPRYLVDVQAMSNANIQITITIPTMIKLQNRYNRNGWCPSTLLAHRRRYNCYTFLEYASYFPATDQPPGKHRLCSMQTCVANNVHPEDVTATHRQEDCECDVIKADLEEARPILDSGAIPVLTYGYEIAMIKADGQDMFRKVPGPMKLHFTPLRTGLRLLAVSHVWSDGLKGTTETGLPRCQVQRLFYIMAAQGADCVWIDALAIPGEHELRQKAIIGMNQVYDGAYQTLILDKGIQSVDMVDNGPWSFLLPILTSVWMHRLWTLPEIMLSKDPHIMFKGDTLVQFAQFQDMITRLSSVYPSPLVSLFARDVIQLSSNFSQHRNISNLSRLLGDRGSSRQDDEAPAVAALLGLDIKPLLEVRGETRMERFWTQIGHVPRELITTDHERLSSPGYRALPKTMLGVTTGYPIMPGSPNSAMITPSGLRGKFIVYDTGGESSISPDEIKYILVPSESTILKIEHQSPDTQLDFDSVVVIATVGVVDWNVPHGRGVTVRRTSNEHDGCSVFEYVGQIEMSYQQIAQESQMDKDTYPIARWSSGGAQEIIIS
ncbi:Hypothetical protein D9617_9g023580 [Elsinoe fawcettii]|nr:Hypothetical protein D9617_9g023580 [Elsinoe fawcettii]